MSEGVSDFNMVVDADGVAQIRFDARNRTMNTLTAASWDALAGLIEQVASDPTIRGAVIASGKANGFCAGADLDEMMGYVGVTPATPEAQREVLHALGRGNRVSRRLETCGKPFAAAITGLALGGGLELALACHYRVVTDDPKLKLGLPETTVGLLPGGGGTQRVPRLLGAAKALPILLEGKPMSPARTLELGLIDAVAPAGEELATARKWILESGDPVARWDKKGFEPPGGGPYTSLGNPVYIAAAAGVAKSTLNNDVAQANIARAVYEGVQIPMDKAIEIETRYFVATVQSPQAKAILRTQFFSYPALRKGPARVGDAAGKSVRKVSVLGAGMMGAGIAHVLAKAGIDTVLVDVTREAAEAGKTHSRQVVAKLVSKGLMSADAGDAMAARILATNDYAAIAGSDVVIETVFEDLDVKAQATRRALTHLSPDTLFATNTSTLPIGRLAEAHSNPSRFLGMHFHSPVDRMELVEVVVGRATSRASVKEALSLVRQMGKTAIVAHDSPFFYTSRVFDTYFREGLEMVVDGLAPAMIDQVGRMTGMPRGPLELVDDVAVDLVDRIAKQRTLLLGAAADRRRSDDVVDALMSEGRFGRKTGAGLYDYPAAGPKRLWAGLAQRWPVRIPNSSPELVADMRRRFLHRQAVEAARCFAQGVLDDPRHADVGAILGWGFPKWTGGPLSYIEQIGIARFVDECEALAAAHGPRFQPPDKLREMARQGDAFYAPWTTLDRAA